MKNTYIASLAIAIVIGLGYFVYFRQTTEVVVQATPTPTQQTGNATVATLSVSGSVSGSASALLAGEKTISWKTSNYPSNAGVNINLLKKVSDSPRQFTLVRVLAKDTANDGSEKWIPQSGETGSDMYVEVTCSTTYAFNSGCTLSTEPTQIN
ncbi:MAG TPA: hypothetical protein VGC58_01710 [Candidatus Paceibacterota bacterium]